MAVPYRQRWQLWWCQHCVSTRDSWGSTTCDLRVNGHCLHGTIRCSILDLWSSFLVTDSRTQTGRIICNNCALRALLFIFGGIITITVINGLDPLTRAGKWWLGRAVLLGLGPYHLTNPDGMRASICRNQERQIEARFSESAQSRVLWGCLGVAFFSSLHN